MKKFFALFFFLVAIFCIAQSKYTVEEVEKTTDPKVVANFVKFNPDHPRTPEFKRKLYVMVAGDTSASTASSTATTSSKTTASSSSSKPVSYTGASKSSSSKSSGPSAENKRTADLLTHLFDNDPNSKDAYIHIFNKSKCNIVMKINGKKSYTLNVPALKDNYVLLDKGNYTLTSTVCNAKYSAVKNVNKDLQITLSSVK